jgi:hypothetical protein
MTAPRAATRRGDDDRPGQSFTVRRACRSTPTPRTGRPAAMEVQPRPWARQGRDVGARPVSAAVVGPAE